MVDKNWGGLVQRYVSTGQGAQGITADPLAIVVYGTPSLVATRQEGFYVPVSRVQTEVAVLTDSIAALRQAIQRKDNRTFAMELFEGTRAAESLDAPAAQEAPGLDAAAAGRRAEASAVVAWAGASRRRERRHRERSIACPIETIRDTNDLVTELFGPRPHLVKGSSRTRQGASREGQSAGRRRGCLPGLRLPAGLDRRGALVQFRLRSGDSETYAYGCLVSVRFNPSVGILLKFSADVTTLALHPGQQSGYAGGRRRQPDRLGFSSASD